MKLDNIFGFVVEVSCKQLYILFVVLSVWKWTLLFPIFKLFAVLLLPSSFLFYMFSITNTVYDCHFISPISFLDMLDGLHENLTENDLTNN